MPRRLLRKILPSPEQVRSHWYLRPFRTRIADPRLWTLQRRSITLAFAAGLAICFVPLPVHLLLAALTAVALRVNLPVIVATVLLVNPFTAVPVYYLAYRVGAGLLNMPPQDFAFEMSWDWLQYGLGPVWKPFLVGCIVCGILAAAAGWLLAELLWRWLVLKRYRGRRRTASG